jgi:hypothetical protein
MNKECADHHTNANCSRAREDNGQFSYRSHSEKISPQAPPLRFVRVFWMLNLGYLHPVARVISYDVGFNPSTQRHYRRLIYYLYILVHSYMFRSYDHHLAEKYITTFNVRSYETTDPL